MLIKKNDIGGEIISILTKGMYRDPNDTLREYVQNGIDAKADKVSIKIRQDQVIIQDNGLGMNQETMRNSIRIGISNKSPINSVGFMGIGIYSSFHLCDEMRIYSRTELKETNFLRFDFKGMRDRLSKQRELKFTSTWTDNDIIALQDLLEENIQLKPVIESEFPRRGTRVELIGMDLSMYKALSKFQDVSSYLERVIALPFNPNFRYGREIQHVISETCKTHGVEFALVDLELQINNETKKLYRPYVDELFDPGPLDPVFYVIKSETDFYGVAWGCLNQETSYIKNTGIRGFVLKKQGFTIGSRNDLLTYFNRQIFFNRYIGEIIVTHPELLPNAARSDFEYSPLRLDFHACLYAIGDHYNRIANNHQEMTKATKELNLAIDFLREKKAKFEFTAENSDELLQLLWQTKEHTDSITRRLNSKLFLPDKSQTATTVISQLNLLTNEIVKAIENKKKRKRSKPKTSKELSEELEEIPITEGPEEVETFDNLLKVFESVGIELNKEFIPMIELIDENFIRFYSKDNEEYFSNLIKLKNDFDELINE